MNLADVEAARHRIAPYVRRTPMLAASPLKTPLQAELYLKLENLQITGSFKARGAVNKMLSLAQNQATYGLVTASGGNHGIGVAYAGWLSQRPVTVFLPQSAPADKVAKITAWNAHVIRHGNVWDEANQAALTYAQEHNFVYFHPFADEMVMAGQGTIGLEILEDQSELDILLVSIGGGGLIGGIGCAIKSLKPNLRIIGVEPIGAPTLYESLQAGHVVELPTISTRAGTLAPRKTDQLNFDLIKEVVDQIVLVSDEEMQQAQHWLWSELGIMCEISGAAAMSALLTSKITTQKDQKVGVLICAANTD